ncbi:heterogeneous nuclear ribonucleoprotein 1-like protein [Tanacetum coccineum]
MDSLSSDEGKLFIGGISWETSEEKLKEYFGNYGDISQTVIMRDKISGRPRGFGFVVFSDPSVLDNVLQQKHTIDGRTVSKSWKWKVAVRKVQGGSTRTKENLFWGLPPTLSEEGFRQYFETYGQVTDVVVMYDQQTNRPRGFGFISFDSEDAVDRVLHKTFHDLNGKQVEVKRALPKDANPGGGGGGRYMQSQNAAGGGGGFPSYGFPLGIWFMEALHLVHESEAREIHSLLLYIVVQELINAPMGCFLVLGVHKQRHQRDNLQVESAAGYEGIKGYGYGGGYGGNDGSYGNPAAGYGAVGGRIGSAPNSNSGAGAGGDMQPGSGGYMGSGYGDANGNSGYGNAGWRADPAQAAVNYGCSGNGWQRWLWR